MKKLLVICGPTATGKTSLAIRLVKKFNGEIISADSRQVYKGMDIGTGKEWGTNVHIWGYDLVDPKKEFSVADFVKFVKRKLLDIEKRGKLPILVGGTGLYIKAVVDGIATVSIPKNDDLRKNLANKNTNELFGILAQLDPIHAGSMNTSDKGNPRRLIRAIEIAQYRLDNPFFRADSREKFDALFVGLTAPKEVINTRIEKRVKERLDKGMEKEVRKLVASGLSWESQAMDSIGYRGWKEYFEGTKTRIQVIEGWKKEEKKYAKRQVVWFKRDKRMKWIDISEPDWAKKVENLVQKWYDKKI